MIDNIRSPHIERSISISVENHSDILEHEILLIWIKIQIQQLHFILHKTLYKADVVNRTVGRFEVAKNHFHSRGETSHDWSQMRRDASSKSRPPLCVNLVQNLISKFIYSFTTHNKFLF